MMRKHLLPLIALLLLLALLPACQPSPTATTALVEASTAPPSATPSITATPSPTEVLTFTPEPTETNNIPAITESNPPKPEFLDIPFEKTNYDYEREILSYINEYGVDQLYYFVEQEIDNDNYDGEWIFEDLTNDNQPELIFSANYLYILSSEEGEFVVKYKGGRYWHGELFPQLISIIQDGNQNGVPEIVILDSITGNSAAFSVIEWSDNEFHSVIFPNDTDFGLVNPEIIGTSRGGVTFEDFDFDGNLELIVYNGKIVVLYDNDFWFFPFREMTRVFKWNGEEYSFYQKYFDDPVYRYQAVQDADYYFGNLDYEKSIDLYQQVIFSDELHWYSESIREYELNKWLYASSDDPDNLTTPAEDPDEYDYLASYARFRIMLLYVLQGWLSDAETVYDTLQNMSPEGQTGHEFAVMAEEFWLEYQQSEDVGLACDAAVAVAEQHPEILAYLGGPQHSARFDKIYAPEDVCPFGSAAGERE